MEDYDEDFDSPPVKKGPSKIATAATAKTAFSTNKTGATVNSKTKPVAAKTVGQTS